ncbi:hypothetical protein Tco_1186463 [Tanacetum coccineum]
MSKTHQQAKSAVNTSKNAWKATKEDVARLVPQWKPTGKRFNLCDIYGPRMSTEPIVTPSKFTPCVSPRTNVTLSMEPVLKPLELTPWRRSSSSSTVLWSRRFLDYRLGRSQGWSKGRTVADSIAERLTRPTAYKFKTDCSIIPVWLVLILFGSCLCISDIENCELSQGGSPAGIHGLFSGWYCGLASRKVTLGVSIAWAKGVTTWTLVRYETSRGHLLGNLFEDKEVRRSG